MVQLSHLLSKIKCKHVTFTLIIMIVLYNIRSSKTPTDVAEEAESLSFSRTIAAVKPTMRNRFVQNVHVFYYAWFRNKQFDGEPWRWYRENTSAVASKFYPSLGLYSSRDDEVIEQHMRMIKEAGIGVVVVGWVPAYHKDAPNLHVIFRHADNYGLKVTLQILDYEDRRPEGIRTHLYDFFMRYRYHRALYKVNTKNGLMPMIYVQHTHKILYPYWRKILFKEGTLSVRGTHMDALYIGTLLSFDDHDHIINSCFDGFYTYSAKNAETYGSHYRNFRYFQEFADVHSLIFIPTIAPGHDDSRTELVNGTQPLLFARNEGKYYISAWFQVMVSRAKYVSINSFNDWNEGTQIEPAKRYQDSEMTFEGYGEKGENSYLDITKEWADIMVERWHRRSL